jgi:hypothetical protein
MTLRAPFPWFGGKSRVSHLVWERFGDVRNYVEPFAGSLAVLLGRPFEARVETVNDANAYLANFWRALAGENADPDAVAYYADWPVNEADLHARHRWLVETAKERTERVMTDPDYFDPKVAGWWVWGQCLWIGSGWCQRPEWTGRAHCVRSARGIHAKQMRADRSGGRAGLLSDTVQESVSTHGHVGDESKHKKRPVLGRGKGRGALSRVDEPENDGKHANGTAAENIVDWRPRPDLSSSNGRGESVKVSRKRPLLTGMGEGVGVNKVSLSRQKPMLAGDSGAAGRGNTATGFDLRTGGIYVYMRELAERLRRVRVCCGDWGRVVTPAVTTCIGTTGMFLDPPYHAPGTERSAVYTHDNATIWHEVRDWAIANGDDPKLRIALCGYEGDHNIPDSWTCVSWKASGGYGRSARGKANRERERIWFSPHCLNPLIDQHSFELDPEAA